MRHLERRLALLCAAAGVLLVFIAASLLLVEGHMSPAVSYTLLAGIALLIGYAVLDPAAAMDLVRSRQARFGSLSVIVTAVAIGILVTFNVLASRSTASVDLTKARLYTLSEKSTLITRRLGADLAVTGFFRPDQQDSQRRVQGLLSLYQQQSGHVKVHYLDPDLNALQARQLGVTIPGSLVLQYRGKPPLVLTLASQTESDVTGAILRLESNRTPTVCWAAGEGERGLTDSDQVHGYSVAAEEIKSNNYQTRELLLSQQGQVPADCDVVALIGLRTALNENAVKALTDYLGGGGKLMLALDPWNFQPLASVNSVLAPYGVSFSGGLVVEGDAAHSASNDPTTPVAFDYGSSPIVKDLQGKYVFFPQTTRITGQATSATESQVVRSTDKAYEIAQPRQSFGREGADKGGPFVLMDTLSLKQSSGRETRLVLFGTSAIAENRTLPPSAAGANSDLLLGSLDYLSEQEGLIGISPKPPSAAPLALTDQQARFTFLTTVVGVPLLFLLGYLAVWLRRRSTYA